MTCMYFLVSFVCILFYVLLIYFTLLDHQKNVLQLKNGVVVAVPIPSEYSTDHQEMEAVISQALQEAK